MAEVIIHFIYSLFSKCAYLSSLRNVVGCLFLDRHPACLKMQGVFNVDFHY